MKKFVVGESYTMNSPCCHDCGWRFIVKARTQQFVTLAYVDRRGDERETVRCRISRQTSEYLGAESVFPLGRYSMAPILSADKVA